MPSYRLQEPKSVLIPLLVLLGLIVITVLWWFSQQRDVGSVTVSVVSSLDNSPVSGAKVFLLLGGGEAAAFKSVNGRVSFDDVPKGVFDVRVEEASFKPALRSFNSKDSSFFTIRLDPLELPVLRNRLVEIVSKPSFAGSSEFDFLSAQKVDESKIEKNGSSLFVEKQLRKGEFIELLGVSVGVIDSSSDSAFVSVSSGNKTVIPRTILLPGSSLDFGRVKIVLVGVAGSVVTLKLVERLTDDSLIKISYPTNDSVVSEPLLAIRGKTSASKPVKEVHVSFDGTNWFLAEGTSDWKIQAVPPLMGQYWLRVRVVNSVSDLVDAEPVKITVSPCKQLLYNGPSKDELDVVFSSSGFANVSELLAQVDSMTGYVFSRAPFDAEANRKKLNLYYYPFDISCKIAGEQGVESRLWSCDFGKDYAASCPFADVSTVVINSPVYGGSGGSQIFITKDRPDLFLHEFGHAFGLADRYCCDGYYVQNDPKPNLFNTRFECFNKAGIFFNNTCRSIGVRSGIAQENWHEVYEDSVMQSLDHPQYAPSDAWGIQHALDSFK